MLLSTVKSNEDLPVLPRGCGAADGGGGARLRADVEPLARRGDGRARADAGVHAGLPPARGVLHERAARAGGELLVDGAAERRVAARRGRRARQDGVRDGQPGEGGAGGGSA